MNVSGSTDATLVAAALAGNVDAFAELSRRHRDRYTRFVERMVGTRDEAEDVLQSAFIRAYRALDRCSDPAHVDVWLYRIVVAECRSYIARRARRSPRLERAAPNPAQSALNSLDVDLREALVLMHEGLGYEQMAAVTGNTVSVLKAQVKAAGARLRQPLVLEQTAAIGDEFEAKLVPALLADRLLERGPIATPVELPPVRVSWWRAPIALQLPPLVAVAIVCVVAATAAIAALTIRPPALPASVFSEVVYDTVYVDSSTTDSVPVSIAPGRLPADTQRALARHRNSK